MLTFRDEAGFGQARGSDACDDPAIKMGEAIELMLSRVRPVAETETVSLVDGLARVLASGSRQRHRRSRLRQQRHGRLCRAVRGRERNTEGGSG